MLYLSKGILPWKASKSDAAVSHGGILYNLTGVQAKLWLDGQYQPGQTQNSEQEAALEELIKLGIAESSINSENAALFRILTNCSICPVRVKPGLSFLNRAERRLWRWISRAGLRLTMAELTYLTEHNIMPVPALLWKENRQALTEAIYTTETIFDGILETHMEKSLARDITVNTVLSLLRKRKIMLL